jgi:hypothetical protein
MAILQAKVGSGNTSRTMRRKARDGTVRTMRRGRPPKASDAGYFQSEYEWVRIREIEARTQLFKLRVGRLSGELIDRKLLIIEFTASFTAIREIILGSSMTQRDKEALLKQLAEIPVVLTDTSAASC